MLTRTLRLQPTDPLSAARHAVGCRGPSRGAAARVPSVRVTQTHRHTHTLTCTHPRGPRRARLCLTERSLNVWMEALCGGGGGGSSARCVAGERAPYLGEAEQREWQQQRRHHGASGSDSLRQVRLLLPLIRTMATRLLRRRLLCDRRATSAPPSSSSSPSSLPRSLHHRRLRFLVESG